MGLDNGPGDMINSKRWEGSTATNVQAAVQQNEESAIRHIRLAWKRFVAESGVMARLVMIVR